jgi:hypothetical protein
MAAPVWGKATAVRVSSCLATYHISLIILYREDVTLFFKKNTRFIRNSDVGTVADFIAAHTTQDTAPLYSAYIHLTSRMVKKTLLIPGGSKTANNYQVNVDVVVDLDAVRAHLLPVTSL